MRTTNIITFFLAFLLPMVSCTNETESITDSSVRDEIHTPKINPVFQKADALKYRRALQPAFEKFRLLPTTNLKRSEEIYANNQLIYLALCLHRDSSVRTGFLRLEQMQIEWRKQSPANQGDYNLNMGINALETGENPTKIDSFFQQALTNYRIVYPPEHIKIAQCHVWTGLLKLRTQPDAAQSYFELAHDMYNNKDNWMLGRPECEMGMAMYDQFQRSYQESIRHCNEVIRLTRQDSIDNHNILIRALTCRAGSQMKIGKTQEALASLDEANILAQKTSAPELNEILKTIVQVYINADSSGRVVFNKIDEILNYQKRGVIKSDSLPEFLTGMYYFRKKNWEKSIRAFEIFLKSERGKFDLMLRDQALYMLALNYQNTGQFGLALERVKQDLQLGRTTSCYHEKNGLIYPDIREASEYEFPAFSLLGRIFLKKYDKNRQIKDLKQATILFSSLDTLYVSKMVDKDEKALLGMQSEFVDSCYPYALEATYAFYKRTHNQAWLNEAFRYCERIKSGIMFREMLSKQIGQQGSYGNLKDSLSKVVNQINRYNLKSENGQALTQYEQDYQRTLFKERDKINAELKQKSLQYAQNIYGSSYSLEQVRKKLGPDEAVIQYGMGQQMLHILYIDRHHTEFIQTDSADVIRREITQYSAFYTGNKTPCPQYLGISTSLYRHLLGPVGHRLASIKKFLVIPDGEIQHIPFEALVDPVKIKTPAQTLTYGTLPYVLYDYQITYSPSWKVHTVNVAKDGGIAPDPELGIWIDTTVQLWSNTYLNPFNSIWGTDHIHSFHNENCTKREFISHCDDFNITYFMVHGLISEDHALDYKLLFARDGGDQLFGYEVQNMRFEKTNLIVLGVCNGAIGKTESAEGPSTLTRSFMQAGIPWAIGGLYTIDETASHTILIDFFRQLKLTRDIPASLQHAKIQYIRREKQGLLVRPFFWSGLVVQH